MSENLTGNQAEWDRLLALAPGQAETLRLLRESQSIDNPIRMTLARMNLVGIQTVDYCSGHLDQNGRLIKQPFVAWSSVVPGAEPIISEIQKVGTAVLLPEGMSYGHGRSSHINLFVDPFLSGIAWNDQGQLNSLGTDESLPDLWLNVQAALNRFDKLGIRVFHPSQFVGME